MADKRKEAPVSEDALEAAVETAKRKAQARTRSIWQEDAQARCRRCFARTRSQDATRQP